MKKSHSTDPSTSSSIQSTPSTTKKSATTNSSGKSTYSTKSWSPKSRTTPSTTNNSIMISMNSMKLKNSGINSGPKSLKRKSDAPRIWSKKHISAPLISAAGPTALMSRLTYIWKSSTTAAPKLKENPSPKKSVSLKKKAPKSKLIWTSLLDTSKSSGKASERKILLSIERPKG